MKENYKNIFCLIVLLSFISLLGGCTAAIVCVSERAYNHVRGDLLAITVEPLEKVYPAVIKAIKSLNEYEIYAKESNTINANITAYDQEARKVTIKLSKTEQDQTEIKIRIGAFGDKIESVFIYDHIKQHIKDSSEKINALKTFSNSYNLPSS